MEEEVEREVAAEKEEVGDEPPVLMAPHYERQREVKRVGTQQLQRASSGRQQSTSHVRAGDDREVLDPLLQRSHRDTANTAGGRRRTSNGEEVESQIGDTVYPPEGCSCDTRRRVWMGGGTARRLAPQSLCENTTLFSDDVSSHSLMSPTIVADSTCTRADVDVHLILSYSPSVRVDRLRTSFDPDMSTTLVWIIWINCDWGDGRCTQQSHSFFPAPTLSTGYWSWVVYSEAQSSEALTSYPPVTNDACLVVVLASC